MRFFRPHFINFLPSDSSSSSSASRARISNGIGDASRSAIRLVPQKTPPRSDCCLRRRRRRCCCYSCLLLRSERESFSSAAPPRRRRVKATRRRGRTKRINLCVVLTEARHGARLLESLQSPVARSARFAPLRRLRW